MNKLSLIALFLLGITGSVYAQSSDNAPPMIDVNPKSPEVAAIEKFGNIPVGLYTGVPDISVPLWNIKLKNFNVPISLSYHASGNKVDEVAPSTGLGWALQFGGVVSCNVNGLPDVLMNGGHPVFSPTGWVNTPYKTPQTGEMKTLWSVGDNPPLDPVYDFYTQVLKGKSDSQPDLFNVSYCGQNIKFFFDQDKQIHLMPYKRVKISMTTDGFTLIDENDNIFEFNNPETSTTWWFGADAESSSSGYTTNTSFLLTRITTPSGEVVKFNYNAGGGYQSNNQETQTRYAPNNVSNCSDQLPPPSRGTSYTSFYTTSVSSIVSSTGDSILFNYNSAREDVATSKLTGVEVHSRQHKLKSFTLDYGYFLSPNPGASTDPEYKRLKLLSVTEEGKSPYVFGYYPLQLPKRLSFAQDHWGYFNESTNDDAGVPTLLPKDDTHGFPSGANREASATGAMAAVLTEIKYPTGGKSAFEYEPNDHLVTETIPISPQPRVNASGNISTVKSVNFTIPVGAYDIRVVYATTSEPMDDIEPDRVVSKVIKIMKGSIFARQLSGSNTSGESITLDPGNYTAKICSDPDNIGVYLTLYWRIPGDQDYQTISSNKYTGGIRVRQISDYSASNETPVISKYEYRQFDHPDVSSGIHSTLPEYVYSYEKEWRDPLPAPQTIHNCTFFCQSTSSLLPLNSVQGGNIFYDQVRVYKKDKASNGYTDTRFYPGGQTIGSYRYPFTPVISIDWLNGLPVETTDYAYIPALGRFTPLKKVLNTYKTNYGVTETGPHESYVRGFKIAVKHKMFIMVGTGGITQWPEFIYENYHLFTSWSYLTQTNEISYDVLDSTKKVSTIKDFHYDNPAHIEMTGQDITKSNGDQYKLQFRYPLDYNLSYGFNSSPLVEKRTIVKNSVGAENITSAELTLYKNAKGSFPLNYYRSDIVAPVLASSIPFYTGGVISPLFEKRLDYTYSSPSNDIVSILKDGKVKTSYIWGYQGLYPVAGCVNAEVNEFFYDGFEDTGVTGNAHSGKKYYNGSSYTVNWTKPNERIYKISYFYLTNGGWIFKEEDYLANSKTLTGGSAYDDVRICPSDAQMISYTYDPLVGMTSMIDPKGQTTYYEYDEFQRLKNVKDQNGNILKNNIYHYKP